MDGDKLSDDSYMEVHDTLNTAIKKFDVSKAAIHTVSIHMFQALFHSSHNQTSGLPICFPSSLY